MARPCLPALRLMLLATLGIFSQAVNAQYPDKPIRLIVPQAAGSNTDIVARALAVELTAVLGQPLLIDNRPGAGLIIGLEIASKAAPDGYTLCMSPIGALAISPHMFDKLPYVVERDFQPISQLTNNPLMLAVFGARDCGVREEKSGQIVVCLLHCGIAGTLGRRTAAYRVRRAN